MFFNSETLQDTASTPKRRRLGTQRILRSKADNSYRKRDFLQKHSPLNYKSQFYKENVYEKCDSPPLPCNQVEYLCDSNNSSVSDIPCSPDVLSSQILKDSEKWESLVLSTTHINRLCNKEESKMCRIEEISEISEEMFESKLEQSNHFSCEQKSKNLNNDIKECFDMINQSICQLDHTKNCNKSSLFETKDSFLLDIRESEIIVEENKSNTAKQKPIEPCHFEGFYGLPTITKGLFKTYRNIEKFYDWQEECLSLPAIRERRNLIYALPTSGGKTLVAEVLMLREVLVRKNNALFILPFVAVVQEKIWGLSPFAVQLEFLVEEYAAGKGHLPPKKRRKKHSIYIATIEKALALVRSLIELDRLEEIGLIVVDELHLIGEKGRGGTLEMLLTTVMFAKPNIQIVGMSATIGNLDEIAKFLKADVFKREFRPVKLDEYVKIGDMLYKLMWGEQLEIVPSQELKFNYTESARRLDPDGLAGIVWGRASSGGCLVFCPTKRNCENVTTLLCKFSRESSTDISPERLALQAALRNEGSSPDLCASVTRGVAYHHAGLGQDERTLLEHAFRSGVLSVLCCTSTLAAGVNLPAARVIVRSARVAREALTLAAYRQMVGRAGRAGHCDTGESIIICPPSEWPQLRGILSGGLQRAMSQLQPRALLLSAVALKLATNRQNLKKLMDSTLMAVQYSGDIDSSKETKTICEEALRELLQTDALEIVGKDAPKRGQSDTRECKIYEDTEFGVSELGQAAIKGCMDLSTAKQLFKDLKIASQSLVLMGSLHLLYLVTPHDGAGIKLDYRHYYSLYCNLDSEGLQTAKVLGITEMNAIRMITGKPITNVPEIVLIRFYLAMMLHDVWKQVPVPVIADKYCVSRGLLQSVVCSATSLSTCAARACSSRSAWAFAALLAELSPRLRSAAAPELDALMELPAVGKARALQLMRAGYKRIEDIAKAPVEDLMSSITHLSRTTAGHLVSAARMMLIEKVENLRAEAEDVMDELNS